MSGIQGGRQRIDKNSVKVMQLRAPGVSTVDAQFLRGQILGGVIFSGFSAQERITIYRNVLAFKGIIPSLSTFFQDVYLLQACVNGVKWLITVPPKKTIFRTFAKCHKSQGDSQSIQETESTIRLGFLMLIAFAMCEY